MIKLFVKNSVRITFLLLIGLTPLFIGSTPAQQKNSSQKANFVVGEAGLQKSVKFHIKNNTNVTLEIKASDDGKKYTHLGNLNPKDLGTFSGKANQLIIAKVVNGDPIPIGRQKLTDVSEQAFKIQKENNGYSFRIAPREK